MRIFTLIVLLVVSMASVVAFVPALTGALVALATFDARHADSLVLVALPVMLVGGVVPGWWLWTAERQRAALVAALLAVAGILRILWMMVEPGR